MLREQTLLKIATAFHNKRHPEFEPTDKLLCPREGQECPHGKHLDIAPDRQRLFRQYVNLDVHCKQVRTQFLRKPDDKQLCKRLRGPQRHFTGRVQRRAVAGTTGTSNLGHLSLSSSA
jgi:hypothetical protein